MVEAVQKRDHGRLVHPLWRRQLERRLELRRLCRHPEHVDLLLEPRRGANADVEVAEHRTLDDQTAAVPLQCVGPHEQDDLGSCACKRSGEETADSACADERVAHPYAHSLSLTPTERHGRCPLAFGASRFGEYICCLGFAVRSPRVRHPHDRQALCRPRGAGRPGVPARSTVRGEASGGVAGSAAGAKKRRRPLRRRSARYGCGWNRKNVTIWSGAHGGIVARE